MFHVNSTQRVKRVARDLQDALALSGIQAGYSPCLEMSARMLGHGSFGMLSRSVAEAPASLDDAEATPHEISSRRALQGAVLSQAGIPERLHEGILRRVRPTDRTRPRGPLGRPRGAYGCAMFDAGGKSGWACVDGGEPFRFADALELDVATVWWTTLSHEDRYRLGDYPPTVLYDRHLPLSPVAALSENDLDVSEGDAAKAAAGLGAEVLSRALAISDESVSAVAHRGIIRAFGQRWNRHHGTDEMPMERVTAWEEFVATSVRSFRGQRSEVFREGRLEYARSMMDTPVPVGPYRHVDLAGNPVSAMRVRYVQDTPNVAFVCVPSSLAQAIKCPIRRGLIHQVSGGRAWIPKPVFDVIGEATDIVPLAVMLAPESRRAGDFLPDAAAAFLAAGDPASWADGVVAEAIWRSGLSGTRHEAGSWQASLAGVYLRGVDRARMCTTAVRMAADGMAVSSYGLGWVRYTRPPA